MRPPVPARVYRQPLRDLAAAWSAFIPLYRRHETEQRIDGSSNPFGAPVLKRSDARRTFSLSGQDIRIVDRYIEVPWGHRPRLQEAPRFRARMVGSTLSLRAERWSDALTMEFERQRQPPPPDTHAGS